MTEDGSDLASSPPARSLAAYQAWLRRRGAGAGSVDQYSFQAARAAAGEDVFTRLQDRKLSPKYKRLIKAAALSRAHFVKDDDLVEALTEIKLPAPVRKSAQVPLSELAWRSLREAIDEAPRPRLKKPARDVLGIMAARGLRSGDVLRLHRSEISSALKNGVLAFEAKGGRRIEFGVGPGWRKYLESLSGEFSGVGNGQVMDLVAPRADAAKRAKSASAAIARSLQSAAEWADLDGYDLNDLHPHILRRTVASLMYVALGCDPAKLMAFMQWSQIGTAMSYVDYTQREELDVVAEKLLEG